ncbi:MAG TPA: hypothetical protein ENN67_06560, partial [Firmicutes bacterium]|nr:hypothetical protein [Bacillota bacterium]
MKIQILIFMAIVLIACSCTFTEKSPEPDDGQPAAGEAVTGEPVADETQTGEEIPSRELESVPLPFELKVGDMVVGSDMTISVPENQGVLIDFYARSPKPSELWVQYPGVEEKQALGAWNSEMAQYFIKFPYGENHLLLTYGDNLYDILVVAGAPIPNAISSTGCRDTFIDFRADSRWEYIATQDESAVGTLVQYVEKMERLNYGAIELTLVTNREGSDSDGTQGTVEIILQCQGDVILVKKATEISESGTVRTIYRDGTVWVPSQLKPDIWWERAGTVTYQSGSERQTYEIRENYR